MWAPRVRLLVAVVSLSLVLTSSAADAAVPSNITTSQPDDTTANATTVVSQEPPKPHRDMCRVHVANNTGEGVAEARPKQLSSIKVPQAGTHAADVAVVMQIVHPDVSALEITLTHASQVGRPASRAIVKAASAEASSLGAADMLQTIFADHALQDFPITALAAPYTGVYRPVQPLRSLVNGTNAISDGVWTLTITDTRANATSIGRTLQLVGWELWLCGGEDGSLLVQGNNVTKQDDGSGGRTASVVIKKSVSPDGSTGALQADGTNFKASVGQGQGTAQQLSMYMASMLPKRMQAAKAALAKDFPQAASAMNAAIDQLAVKLSALPGILGYKVEHNGTFAINNAPDLQLAGNIAHCMKDLYWCYSHSGLGSNLAVELATAFERTASGPVQQGLAGQAQMLAQAMRRFVDTYPGFGQWSDVLFETAFQRLHQYALLDAERAFFEAYVQTAIKLAIFLSPVQFSIDPAIAVAQVFQLVIDIARNIVQPFRYLPFTVDARINNRISLGSGLVTAADNLFTALQEVLGLASDGLDQAAQLRAGQLSFSSGQLADSLKSINSQFEDGLASFSPATANIYKSVADPAANVASSVIDTAGQAAVNAYFRQTANNKDAREEFLNTVALLGNITVSLANGTANVLADAQQAIAPGMPLPLELLQQITNGTQSIIDDARNRLMDLVPVAELDQASQILGATVDAVLSTLTQASDQLAGTAPADQVQRSLMHLIEGLRVAQSDVANTFDAMARGLPGPLLNNTLNMVKAQTETTVNSITDMFDELGREFPHLDPTVFINNLNATLEELLLGTTNNLGAFSALSPYQAALDLGRQIPDMLAPVIDTLQVASSRLSDVVMANLKSADGQPPVPAGLSAVDQQMRNTLQTATNEALNNMAQRISGITQALPDQPPLASIASDINSRLSSTADALSALAPAMQAAGKSGGVPPGVLRSQLAAANTVLEGVLRDVQGTQEQAPALADALLAGPLGQAAKVLGDVSQGLASTLQAAGDTISQILPGPQLSDILNPAQATLDSVIQGASKLGVAALQVGSEQLVGGLQGAVEMALPLLVDGQNAAANILENSVGGLLQLQQDARNSTLAAVDGGMAAINAATKQALDVIGGPLSTAISALTPDADVLLPVLRPVLGFMDDRVGNIAQVVQRALPDAQAAMAAAGEQLQNTASEVAQQLASLAASGRQIPGAPPLPDLLAEAAGLIGQTIMETGNNLTEAMLSLPPASFERVIAEAVVGVAQSAETAQSVFAGAASLLPQPGAVVSGLLEGGSNAAIAGLQGVLQMTQPLAAAMAVGENLSPEAVAQTLTDARDALLQLLPAPLQQVRAAQAPQVGSRFVALGNQLLSGLQQTLSNAFTPLRVGERFTNAVAAGVKGAAQALTG